MADIIISTLDASVYVSKHASTAEPTMQVYTNRMIYNPLPHVHMLLRSAVIKCDKGPLDQSDSACLATDSRLTKQLIDAHFVHGTYRTLHRR